MKKICFALAIVCCLFALPLLGGCAAHPAAVEWTLDYYLVDGVTYSTRFDEMDYFATVPSDAVTISFSENGSFAFKDYKGKKYTGEYQVRSRMGDGSIQLKFDDGTVGSGWCRKGAFDGVWYDAYFEIRDVGYFFYGNYSVYGLEEGLELEGERLREFDKHSDEYNYYGKLYRGEVTSEDDAFFLTVCNNYGEVFKFNLSREYSVNKVYCYEYDGDYVITQTNLREGECAVKWYEGKREFALHYKAEE